jgi:hypothetical protein
MKRLFRGLSMFHGFKRKDSNQLEAVENRIKGVKD